MEMNDNKETPNIDADTKGEESFNFDTAVVVDVNEVSSDMDDDTSSRSNSLQIN